MTRRDFAKRGLLWLPVAGLLHPRQAQAAVTYFGRNETGGGHSIDAFGLTGYLGAPAEYLVCPGTGKQSVKELGGRFKRQNTDEDYPAVRMALYATDGTFICQGSALVDVTNSSYAWFSHTAFVDASGTAIADPQIDGGSSYYIAWTGRKSTPNSYTGVDLQAQYIGDDQSVWWKTTASISGFPSPLGSGYTETYNFWRCPNLRCGVEPAAAASGRRPLRIINQ